MVLFFDRTFGIVFLLCSIRYRVTGIYKSIDCPQIFFTQIKPTGTQTSPNNYNPKTSYFVRKFFIFSDFFKRTFVFRVLGRGLGVCGLLMPGVVVESLEAGRLIKDAEGNDDVFN